MFSFQRSTIFVCRTLAVAAVLSAGAAMTYAQTSETNTEAGAATTVATPALNLQLPASELNAKNMFSSSSSSSSDTAEVASVASDHLAGLNAMQYGGHRYGRPRYRGGNTNADGSSKYTFVVGGGFTEPVNGTETYNDLGWDIKVGGGRNFNKHFGLLVEYNYDRLGLNDSTLAHQAALYESLTGDDFSALDGNAHVWSITLNPIIHVISGEKAGMYITGGGGFYRKITNFTYPQISSGCYDEFDCGYFQTNQTIDHYSNNAGGANGGLGFDYKLSRFSGEKLFAEARYTWVDNSQSANSVNSFYPQNNFRTIYVPVTVGLRW